jgi:hypothetical protein
MIGMKKNVLLIVVIMMMTIACCVTKPTKENTTKEINHVTALPGFDIDSLYNAFLECSKYEGDMGCDSCWQLIMNGKVDDSYWHEHQSYLQEFNKE